MYMNDICCENAVVLLNSKQLSSPVLQFKMGCLLLFCSQPKQSAQFENKF